MTPTMLTNRQAEECSKSVEVRKSSRFPFARPLLGFRLLANGDLDQSTRFEGTSIDLSSSGIAFEVAADALSDSDSLLVGLLDNNGTYNFAVMTVTYQQPKHASPNQRVGGFFGGVAQQLLQSKNRLPTFDSENSCFRTPNQHAAFRSWIDAGVLRERLLDKVTVCPQCQSIPTFRRACEGCKSARVTNDKLIHHFACGHVGHVAEFEREDELTCPKCLTRQLIVGSDYEFLIGPYRCEDCGWCNSELLSVGHCLRCNYRFDMCQAHELELYSYDVKRMDPLALVASVY